LPLVPSGMFPCEWSGCDGWTGCVGLLLALPGPLGDPESSVRLESPVGVGVEVAVGGLVVPGFGPPPLPPPPCGLPPPALPAPVAEPPPAVVEAICPAAALTGTVVVVCEGLGVAALSSTLPSTDTACPLGQTLNETRPTKVTKTMAAPAKSAPEAPTPTMKLSGVLLLDVLVAA
jgi:hypothetical protein